VVIFKSTPKSRVVADRSTADLTDPSAVVTYTGINNYSGLTTNLNPAHRTCKAEEGIMKLLDSGLPSLENKSAREEHALIIATLVLAEELLLLDLAFILVITTCKDPEAVFPETRSPLSFLFA
jgi:hypothetical protein